MSSLLYSVNVYLYRFDTHANSYEPENNGNICGSALLSSSDASVFSLLLYTSSKSPIQEFLVSNCTSFSIQSDLYVSFRDQNKVLWSLKFKEQKEVYSFMHSIGLLMAYMGIYITKTYEATKMYRNELYSKKSNKKEQKMAENGDTIEIKLRVWKMEMVKGKNPLSITENPCHISTEGDQTLTVTVSDTNEVVKGISEGYSGMTRHGKRLVVWSPTKSQEEWMVAEVELVKIKKKLLAKDEKRVSFESKAEETIKVETADDKKEELLRRMATLSRAGSSFAGGLPPVNANIELSPVRKGIDGEDAKDKLANVDERSTSIQPLTASSKLDYVPFPSPLQASATERHSDIDRNTTEMLLEKRKRLEFQAQELARQRRELENARKDVLVTADRRQSVVSSNNNEGKNTLSNDILAMQKASATLQLTVNEINIKLDKVLAKQTELSNAEILAGRTGSSFSQPSNYSYGYGSHPPSTQYPYAPQPPYPAQTPRTFFLQQQPYNQIGQSYEQELRSSVYEQQVSLREKNLEVENATQKHQLQSMQKKFEEIQLDYINKLQEQETMIQKDLSEMTDMIGKEKQEHDRRMKSKEEEYNQKLKQYEKKVMESREMAQELQLKVNKLTSEMRSNQLEESEKIQAVKNESHTRFLNREEEYKRSLQMQEDDNKKQREQLENELRRYHEKEVAEVIARYENEKSLIETRMAEKLKLEEQKWMHTKDEIQWQVTRLEEEKKTLEQNLTEVRRENDGLSKENEHLKKSIDECRKREPDSLDIGVDRGLKKEEIISLYKEGLNDVYLKCVEVLEGSSQIKDTELIIKIIRKILKLRSSEIVSKIDDRIKSKSAKDGEKRGDTDETAITDDVSQEKGVTHEIQQTEENTKDVEETIDEGKESSSKKQLEQNSGEEKADVLPKEIPTADIAQTPDKNEDENNIYGGLLFT